MVKRVVLMAAVLTGLVLLPAASFATLVTYSTTGAFTGTSPVPTSSTELNSGGAKIVYTAQASTTVNANPNTGANLGTFTVSCPSVCNGNFNDSFQLTINQTSPSGTGNTSTTVNGNIQGNSNSIS